MVKNIESESRRHLRAESHAVFGSDFGCVDAGCIYGTAPGMHTNGGCCCMKGTPLEVRMIAVRLRAVAVILSHKALTATGKLAQLREQICRLNNFEPKQDLLDIIDKAPRRSGQQVARDIPVTIGTDEKSP